MKSASKKSRVRKSASKKSRIRKSAFNKSRVRKSASNKSRSRKSASKKSRTRKSASNKSRSRKSASNKSRSRKSASKKSRSRKSASKKSRSRKSASKKSRSRKSASKKSRSKSNRKPCKSNQVRNQSTKRCRNKSPSRKQCKSNQVRNRSTHRCRNKSRVIRHLRAAEFSAGQQPHGIGYVPIPSQGEYEFIINTLININWQIDDGDYNWGDGAGPTPLYRQQRNTDYLRVRKPNGRWVLCSRPFNLNIPPPLPPPRLPHGFMPYSSSLGNTYGRGASIEDDDEEAPQLMPSGDNRVQVYRNNGTHKKEHQVIDINSYSSYQTPGKKLCYNTLKKKCTNIEDCYVIGIVYSAKDKPNIPNDVEIGFGGALTTDEIKLTHKGQDNKGYDQACARELQEESQFSSVTDIKEYQIGRGVQDKGKGYWREDTIDSKGKLWTKVGLTYLIPANKLKMGVKIEIDNSGPTSKRIDMYVFGTKKEIEDMASKAITEEENVYGFAVIPFNDIMNLPTMTNNEHSVEHNAAVFMCEKGAAQEYHYWCDKESGISSILGIITSGGNKTKIKQKMQLALKYWREQYSVINTGREGSWWRRNTSQDRENAEDFNKSLNKIKNALAKCIEGRTNYPIDCPEYASKDVNVISGHENVISEYKKLLNDLQKIIDDNTQLANTEHMKQMNSFLDANWLKNKREKKDESNRNYLLKKQTEASAAQAAILRRQAGGGRRWADDDDDD